MPIIKTQNWKKKGKERGVLYDQGCGCGVGEMDVRNLE